MAGPVPDEVRLGSGSRIDVPALYAGHWRAMTRLAVLLVDDLAAAEDVVQDAFLSLHHHQARVREPAAAAGYLRMSVVNGCRAAIRHRQVVRRRLAVVAGRTPQSYTDVVPEDDTEVVLALRQLPDRMQEVLVLRYWMDLSEAEIAATLGISAGAVKSTASRGISKLRSALGGAS